MIYLLLELGLIACTIFFLNNIYRYVNINTYLPITYVILGFLLKLLKLIVIVLNDYLLSLKLVLLEY